jgi:nucleoside phosphorylase
MSTNEPHEIDICVLCALAEEADQLKKAFQDASAKIFQGQPPVVFKRYYNEHLKRDYDYTTIKNVAEEQVSVLVTWLPENGPMETGIQLHSLLKEFNPLFAAMTGICAGDREKVQLGDIIVADRAYLCDVGKMIEGKNGPGFLRDTQMWSLPTEVLHFVRGFNNWKQVVKKEKRPPSMHQQRDWLLNRLLAPDTSRIGDIPETELEEHVPDLRKVIQELRKGGPDAYLTSDRRLNSPDRIRELRFERVFPFKDAPQPAVYIAPMASGSAVRADNPFEEIRVPVRGTRAVEMEGAAFYRTLKDFESIQYLLVKGVCDYADKEKDDSYHDYAGKISALYLLAFLREYVTSSRFPSIRIREKAQEAPLDTPILAGQEQSSTQEPQNGLNLFYSYAPKDEEMCQELGKHLVMLKRKGLIRQSYANDISAGLSKDAVRLLEQAQIILLLISPDFMSTDELYDKHLKKAFELQKEGKARIVPVLLRPTNLKETPLEDVIVIPRYDKPINKWSNKDEAYLSVSEEIRKVIEEFKKSKG